MTKSIKAVLLSGLLAAALAPMAGCNPSVNESLAISLRDSTVTTAGGLLEAIFNQRFGLDQDQDDSTEEDGDDLFVRT